MEWRLSSIILLFDDLLAGKSASLVFQAHHVDAGRKGGKADLGVGSAQGHLQHLFTGEVENPGGSEAVIAVVGHDYKRSGRVGPEIQSLFIVDQVQGANCRTAEGTFVNIEIVQAEEMFSRYPVVVRVGIVSHRLGTVLARNDSDLFPIIAVDTMLYDKALVVVFSYVPGERNVVAGRGGHFKFVPENAGLGCTDKQKEDCCKDYLFHTGVLISLELVYLGT